MMTTLQQNPKIQELKKEFEETYSVRVNASDKIKKLFLAYCQTALLLEISDKLDDLREFYDTFKKSQQK